MSTFEVKVRRIDKVEDHPDADRLSICSILDLGGDRMRPILKAVSPAYLMKEDGSEVQ